MAGHIQDRWYKTELGPDGKTRRVKTERYGSGLRYRARYIGPDGTEKSKSFPDRQRRLAEAWLAQTKADMERGHYIDPKAGRTTFQQYAEKWLGNHGADPNTGFSMESQLRLHAFPYIGSRPLGSFQPDHIRGWLGQLSAAGVRGRTPGSSTPTCGACSALPWTTACCPRIRARPGPSRRPWSTPTRRAVDG